MGWGDGLGGGVFRNHHNVAVVGEEGGGVNFLPKLWRQMAIYLFGPQIQLFDSLFAIRTPTVSAESSKRLK